MRAPIVTWLATALLLFAAALPATASALPSGGLTAQEIAIWLRAANFTATIKPSPGDATEQIVSSTVDGINYDIYLYSCTAGRCKSMQYAAGWTTPKNATSDALNVWNRDNRYCRAYQDKKGAAWCEYDIDIDPGGSYEELDATMARWRGVVVRFSKYVT